MPFKITKEFTISTSARCADVDIIPPLAAAASRGKMYNLKDTHAAFRCVICFVRSIQAYAALQLDLHKGF